MQVPPPHAAVKAPTETLVPVASVLFGGVVQSTWNLRELSALAPPPARATNHSEAPAGGAVVPSSVAGRKVCSPLLVAMKHCWVAAAPVSMAERLKAQSSEPRPAVPDELKRLKLA